MKRRGPVVGYDTGPKRQYRRDVWATFRRAFGGQVADRHALLMPSIEGDEIEVALANGFRLPNLHVVDDNPAIVATLNRRYGNRLNTYGVSVGRAAERIARERGPIIEAANLDLCSQVSGALEDELAGFVRAGCLADDSVVAVTVLRGREGRWFAAERSTLLTLDRAVLGDWREIATYTNGGALADETGGGDRTRDLTIRDVLWTGVPRRDPEQWTRPVIRDVIPLRSGAYRSPNAKQTMLWNVYRLTLPQVSEV